MEVKDYKDLDEAIESVRDEIPLRIPEGTQVIGIGSGHNESTHEDYKSVWNWTKGDIGVIISYMGKSRYKQHVYKIQKDTGAICLVRAEGFKPIVS